MYIKHSKSVQSCPVEKKDLFRDANISLSTITLSISNSLVTWLSIGPRAFSLMILLLMSAVTHYLTSTEYEHSTYNSYRFQRAGVQMGQYFLDFQHAKPRGYVFLLET